MAELILSRLGAKIGGQLFNGALRSIAQKEGRKWGRALGRRIDAALFGEDVRIQGPRMQELHVQGSTEGDPIARVFGRIRLSGELIWAARLKEHREKTRAGKGGGARTDRYRYTASFAIGLCEGVVSRVERVWANGQAIDLSRVTWRFYPGTEDQPVDPCIEAIEGADATPAYRGLSYIVFEDFPLDDFGSVLPQFSFEVVRPPQARGPDSLENLARGVCLIPGSGEHALSTTIVRRVAGPGAETTENAHVAADRSDLDVALDQLQAALPGCASVLVVAAWFGDDLRCGECQIRPGVETLEKTTRPVSWRVQQLSRTQALLISQTDGAPAYGGTPSDGAVVSAIAALKARGLKVGLYPFVLMDIPPTNQKPNPYGGLNQPAFPWRGRITVHPAAGQPATADKTTAAQAQIDAFFGTATAADFSSAQGEVVYAGASEWSLRRMVLHYAALAQIAGGVDAFIIGSELRGVTTARSSATQFPAVTHLQTLAAEARSLLGPMTKITYAADWSEYFGHQPADQSGDVFFHLDPLWADANINMIGLDWYPPLSDWRDGDHLDANIANGPHDLEYLMGRIEAGEGYDWFYADVAARASQTRTPITDGAYAKPWVFRPKDLRNWWANAHYDRPGGVQSATPTAWVPQSKPFWFVELGCPAIDKGANAPNLFVDPKSSESGWPPFSDGSRDDVIQRRAIEAYLRYWSQTAGHNPISTVYGGPMIDTDQIHLWAFDSRPFPAFPALSEVWADGPTWRLGHWLNGRVGATELAAMIKELCLRAGVPEDRIDVSQVSGVIGGVILDAPSATASALSPVLAAYGLDLVESEGMLRFAPRQRTPAMTVQTDDLIARVDRLESAESAPDLVRVRYLDAARDYRFAVAYARNGDGANAALMDLPLALDEAQAEALAHHALAELRAARCQVEADLAPRCAALEVGDVVQLPSADGLFQIVAMDRRRARFVRIAEPSAFAPIGLADPEAGFAPPPAPDPTPAVAVVSLPPLLGAENDDRPVAAVFATPWRAALTVHAGPDRPSVRQVGQVEEAAIMGTLDWALWPGPIGRWDRGNVFRVRLFGGGLESLAARAVLDGANAFAVLTPDGAVEILQAQTCELVGPQTWRLSTLLRGLQGTACAAPAPVGSTLIRLDGRLSRLDLPPDGRAAATTFVVPRMGEAPSGAGAAELVKAVGDVWARPFAPAHLRARRLANGDVVLSWLRCARLGGDPWDAGEPPLGEAAEAYIVEIYDGATLKRTLEVAAPEALYLASAQAADFPTPPASLKVRVSQVSARYGKGQVRESILWL